MLDSEALKIASKYAAEQVQKLQTHVVTFDPHIFAEKLVIKQYSVFSSLDSDLCTHLHMLGMLEPDQEWGVIVVVVFVYPCSL